MFRSSHRLCCACSYRLLSVFTNGIINPATIPRHQAQYLLRNNLKYRSTPLVRTFTTQNALRASVLDDSINDNDQAEKSAQLEAIARQARQTFGDTLPENFLSEEEYLIYERLYGPPSATTLPEDVDLLMGDEGGQGDEGEGVGTGAALPPNVLLREDQDGNLEEVVFEDGTEDYMEEEGQLERTERVEEKQVMGEELEELGEAEEAEGVEEAEEVAEEDIGEALMEEEFTASMEDSQAEEGLEQAEELASTDRAMLEEFQIRMDILREQNVTRKVEQSLQKAEKRRDLQLNKNDVEESSNEMSEEGREIALEEEAEDEPDEYDTSSMKRTHPLTETGRSGLSPPTLQLPKDSLVNPTTALFADVSNKQLKEVALKTFGGNGLPTSTATMRRPNLMQATIPLEASHGQMGEMEANTFLAAIHPGAYASTISVLVEVRKRLGSDWLRSLMAQPGGPRILDAGSGGAAVLAWREVIKAEHESMHPNSPPGLGHLPFGKSTVVTGSDALRQRASALLENTSFIPRLPDYNPSRDHPSLESSNPQPRKQYDIIIAPYTLWSLNEDYKRQSQIQNLWSLLAPRGGVLVLIEKGIARGFELIAGARETLLQHHISSPGAERAVDPVHPNRFTHKERGMIIAPCTNHSKCPMYLKAGRSQGRKDFCHFRQRFIRPPYLQRILGENERNHEDISFSYVALQRGKDLREDESFVQGTPGADAAFAGFEDADLDHGSNDNTTSKGPPAKAPPNFLALPRAILHPLKRHGHVILDLCTPAGTIERWTVPKSFSKQAYRDARKSQWGDLWALGAKTRVPRNLRVATKQKAEEMEEEEELDDEGVPVLKRRKRSGFKGKEGSRERKVKSRKDKKPQTIEDWMLGRNGEMS